MSFSGEPRFPRQRPPQRPVGGSTRGAFNVAFGFASFPISLSEAVQATVGSGSG